MNFWCVVLLASQVDGLEDKDVTVIIVLPAVSNFGPLLHVFLCSNVQRDFLSLECTVCLHLLYCAY